MSWLITPTQLLVDDQDALTYLTAVEAADGQALESGVRLAVNAFVKGCKADGIWPAIKASCILAGARTLDGALVPLVGTAPTNNNFASGDYNRKTGLVGDGSTKYLDSNRNNNDDPEGNAHISAYVSQRNKTVSVNQIFIGSSIFANGAFHLVDRDSDSGQRVQSSVFNSGGPIIAVPTLFAVSRFSLTQYERRINNASTTISQASNGSNTDNVEVFSTGGGIPVTARLAFYSIGESLNLALLDTRVTTLVNALSAAIP